LTDLFHYSTNERFGNEKTNKMFVLQCITVYWSELQCVSPVRFNTICAFGSVLERIVCVAHCSVLQCVMVCCRVLQCAVRY